MPCFGHSLSICGHFLNVLTVALLGNILRNLLFNYFIYEVIVLHFFSLDLCRNDFHLGLTFFASSHFLAASLFGHFTSF